ncbi:membrane-bound lytic murein transglycosylase MltF [Azoarcus sp. L1K30]|uniref:membrane-bound lytic murein transglycosylase MltF n=1 Tax=Azoarcus sp. L1K30 TaxID=2820277 RepID=UPI001B81A3C5|nr:membrane-bound lytic murein transglycosylase MltF [Azoarcus sp. L1K30]MBR0564691.1 membrane-bound lytic murein transglycosylase MltF [Azoarcus sp. L1K30]
MRLFATLLLSALLLTACESQAPARLADYRTLGELRVATRFDAISYRVDEDGNASGFEHDLLERLADTLGVPVRFQTYPDSARAIDAVLNGEAHLAAAGLAQNDRFPLRWSAPLREVEFVLAGNADSPEINREVDLAGRTVTLRRGTLAADAIEQIRRREPTLKAKYVSRAGDQSLLADLSDGKLDLVATDRVHFSYAAQIAPSLTVAYELPVKSHIAWATPIEADGGLGEQVADFLDDARSDGLIARISDRYFGHIRRLDEQDITAFLVRVQERLPRFIKYFQDAEASTGIDWRYLAAVAYQESQWDPVATSRTGVRGMMMLTSETADRLGIDDRLDARQSILGGARYISLLEEQLPDEVQAPDRLWMATAAYNLGMGHFNGARAIARKLGKDETSWWDMKSVLPLMSRPEYAARLKSGPARGGEAVIMTENVRNYHDILTRLQTVNAPLPGSPKLRLSRQE